MSAEFGENPRSKEARPSHAVSIYGSFCANSCCSTLLDAKK